MNNLHTEWTQSRFIDQPQYEKWSNKEKQKAARDEKHRVKDDVLGDVICSAVNPDAAKWIADRLNLAAKLEQMTYDFAAGKTDGEEIVKMVQEAISA